MTRRAVRAAVLLAVIVGTVPDVADAQAGTLAGTVLDHTNRTGLDGVVITIAGIDTVVASDRNGRFIIPNVPAGTRQLWARRPGYSGFTLFPVHVSAGDTAHLTFSMALETVVPRDVSWAENATDYRGMNGRAFAYRCPPAGSARSVWGTDIYTDDSSVCTAAVHAGRISFVTGGVVTFEIAPGLDGYPPSARNGVSSSQYGSWQGSFIIR